MEKEVFTIAIFASGNGSNAINIINYFKGYGNLRFTIYVNNENAGINAKAKSLEIPVVLIDRSGFYQQNVVLVKLEDESTDLIVLAGFLWLVPPSILERFPNKVVNLHPALLPSYGGKGMYGKKVHEAVLAAKEKESGITIHFANQQYDEGDIILQARCRIGQAETVASLAKKIQKLEHRYFPVVIESLIEHLGI